MRIFITIVAVLLIAVYGFSITLPTSSGILRIHSGFTTE